MAKPLIKPPPKYEGRQIAYNSEEMQSAESFTKIGKGGVNLANVIAAYGDRTREYDEVIRAKMLNQIAEAKKRDYSFTPKNVIGTIFGVGIVIGFGALFYIFAPFMFVVGYIPIVIMIIALSVYFQVKRAKQKEALEYNNFEVFKCAADEKMFYIDSEYSDRFFIKSGDLILEVHEHVCQAVKDYVLVVIMYSGDKTDFEIFSDSEFSQ